MLYDAIKNFNKQFEYEPEIENAGNFKVSDFDNFIVAGMGGSHLAADLLKRRMPDLKIKIHSDYGLPVLTESGLSTLVILSSYSGNTEEVLDVYERAGEKNLSRIVVSTGGELLDSAKKDGVPYVQLPDTGIQPRCALGFSCRALLKIMREEKAFKEAGELAGLLKPLDFKEAGRRLADKIRDFVPIIYSSGKNCPIALNWKIKFNETGKIPAFCNFFPELNHNEMSGFDRKESNRKLSQNFFFIFLSDPKDAPRIAKRMEVLKKMLLDKGFPVEIIRMEGRTVFHKIFSSLALADWAACYTAENYGVEPEKVSMVDEFKKLIKQ